MTWAAQQLHKVPRKPIPTLRFLVAERRYKRAAPIIFRQADRISALTTAATVWATAAVGLAVAYRMLVLPALMALLLYGLLMLHHWSPLKKIRTRSE